MPARSADGGGARGVSAREVIAQLQHPRAAESAEAAAQAVALAADWLNAQPSAVCETLYTAARGGGEAHEVAQALVGAVQALPEPLLPLRVANQFTLTLSIGDSSERTSQMKLLVQGLPPRSRDVLGAVLSHLHIVARQRSQGRLSVGAAALAAEPSPWLRALFPAAAVQPGDAAQRASAVLALLIEHSRYMLDAMPGTGGYINSLHSSPTDHRIGGGAERTGDDSARNGFRITVPPPLSPAGGGGSPSFPVGGDYAGGFGATPVRETEEQAQQVFELVESVVDALCFGGAGLEFDLGFRAQPAGAAKVQEREQRARQDAQFGPRMRVRPGAHEQAPIEAGLAAQPPIVPTQGADSDGWSQLQQAIAQLNSRRSPANRTPAAVARLADQQLTEEKRALKQGLRAFDQQFERVMRRAPEKVDKEPLRAVYAYYKDLKRELERRSLTAQPGSVLARAMEEEKEQSGGLHRIDTDPFLPSARAATGHSQPGDGAGRQPSGGQQEAPRRPSTQQPAPQDAPLGGSRSARAGDGELQRMDSARLLPPDYNPGSGNAAKQAPNTGAGLAVPSCGIALPCDPLSLTRDQVAALRSEKKAIKKHLFAFMAQFKEVHGREVKTKDDRAPCAAEYERYRLLKALLQDLDGGAAD
eukprot:TRINITY_DN60001_c0_g1_i1.p1 TRINITY_DN60001_c0_g1~~TRINITY_DN60001_c0_g1_i1.p1  ORF type:complete len:644 (+),score=221.14 TRINITY_DN60001_c0_g1_i1:171-2102(+)